jgi:hypothetical protein
VGIFYEKSTPVVKITAFLSPGSVTFHIRRKPADLHLRKRKKKQSMKEFASESALMTEDRLPFLVPILLFFISALTFLTNFYPKLFRKVFSDQIPGLKSTKYP